MNRMNSHKIISLVRLMGLAACIAMAVPKMAAEEDNNADLINLLKEFLQPGANHATLSKQLRPTTADYAEVFDPDLSAKLEALYGPVWDAGQLVIAPKPGQTELKLFSATSDEMKSWTGKAADFPGGWKQVAPKLKPGFTIYRFKFVEPGKDLGMAFDGLIFVNGHWRIFPKPWRALEKS